MLHSSYHRRLRRLERKLKVDRPSVFYVSRHFNYPSHPGYFVCRDPKWIIGHDRQGPFHSLEEAKQKCRELAEAEFPESNFIDSDTSGQRYIGSVWSLSEKLHSFEMMYINLNTAQEALFRELKSALRARRDFYDDPSASNPGVYVRFRRELEEELADKEGVWPKVFVEHLKEGRFLEAAQYLNEPGKELDERRMKVMELMVQK